MPLRDSTPAGAPCWVDLFTSDPDTARTFYGELFGWTAEAADEEYGGYFSFYKDGALVAGGMLNDGSQGAPDSWTTYLAVDDADKAAADIKANGGQMYVEPMDVGELGRMAVFAGPDGGVLGFWQPGEHRGFELYDEPGAPGWFELNTRNYDRAKRFYTDTFGWEIHDVVETPEMRYATYGEGDDARAGIMDASAFLPEGVPCHWAIYFRVDDAAEAAARIPDLGGTVLSPVDDTPYGRMIQAADPSGVTFKVLSRG